MAVLKGPMLSLDASGSIGGAITFSKWKGRNYARELVKPANPNSGLQVSVRAMMRFITQEYGGLSATIKGRWEDEYPSLVITGLNAMVKLNQERNRQFLGAKQDPTLAAGAVEAAPGGVVATAAPKSVRLTWTDSIGADDWCTLIYRSTTLGFTPGPSNLLRVVPDGLQAFTDVGLTTGTPYYYRLGGCETGGTLGTLAAEVTATPT